MTHKEISNAYSGFSIISDEYKKKIPMTDIIDFNYEEVFVNMVSHIILRFGEDGHNWLKAMTKDYIEPTPPQNI